MKHTRHQIRAACSALAFMAAAIATPAGAQDPEEDQAQNVASDGNAYEQDIIVTAEKRAQTAQSLPLAVTVKGEEELQRIGAQNFTDFAVTVPSLSFQSLAPGEQRVVIRGVSDTADSALRGAAQNTTGIYIDEAVVSNYITSPDLNLFDVNRVEVLKGPQGTLYGDGSAGGLIRIITNKANANEFEGRVQARFGSIRKGGLEKVLNGMVNVPLVDGKLGLRVVGQFRDADGFIDDVQRGIDNVNDVRQIGARASLRWEPTNDLNVTLAALIQRTDLNGRFDYEPARGDLKRGTFFAEPIDTDFNLYTAVVEWSPGPINIVSSTAFTEYDRLQRDDFSISLVSVFGALFPSIATLDQHGRSFSQEVRFSSNGEGPFNWVAGAYYYTFKERVNEFDVAQGSFDFIENVFGIPVRGTIFDIGEDALFESHDRNEQERYAVFGEATYDLTDSLSATAGLRWYKEKEGQTSSAAGVVLFAPPFTETTPPLSNDGVAFRGRLTYAFDDDALIYALASQGYRSGGINPLNPVTVNDPNFPRGFENDSLWNYEFGWKTRLMDRRITFNGAAYFIDWKNIQVQLADPNNGFSFIANAGRAHIFGVELETLLNVTDFLTVGASGSLQKAELAEDTADPGLPGEKGDRLVGVPSQQFSLFADAAFPLSGTTQGFVRGDLSYIGEIRRNFGPNPTTYGDYTLVNLRAGVTFDTFEVTAFVHNLFDKRAAFSRVIAASGTPFETEVVNVAQPRTIGVSLTKSF